MKKILCSIPQLMTLVLFIMISSGLCAQGIYQLWGTTNTGGIDNNGVIFTTKFDGTGYQLKKNFPVTNPGKAEDWNQPEVYNGKLFCALSRSGLNDDGMIAEYNPITNAWVKRAEFNSIGGDLFVGSLTLYNSKFYGVCLSGGMYDEGLIFEFDPTTFLLTKLYDFNSTSGGYPNNGMTLYNGKLYGVAGGGGLYNDGVIYEFNPANNVYTPKANFIENITGYCNSGTKLVVYNSLLWGTTNIGGQSNGAAIFSFNPATNALLKKVEINTIGSNTCYNSLTLLNGKLYGSTAVGGANNSGVIFEYNPATNILVSKYNLTYTTVKHTLRFTVYNSILYGCSASGGANNEGQLCSFNPVTSQYTALVDLSLTNGMQGAGALTFYNNRFYGFTTRGSAYGKGNLFSYDLLTSTFAIKVQLGGSELTNPTGAMIHYNGKLYGTCELGGLYENDHGVGGIYEFDPANDIYTIKQMLHDTTASIFDQGGFTLLNDKFYMVSSYGGSTNEGSLCAYDPAMNSITKLHDFTFTTGSYPYGRLSVYNGKLYGMCKDGSSSGKGNLYEYNPATDVYSEKVVLDSAKGWRPYGGLTWYNNKFYGCCWAGGPSYGGTIFEYNPAINSYVKKYDFDSTSGDHCVSGLTEFNGKLYGMTMFGGVGDSGTIFEYNPLNNVYAKKIDLTKTTGFEPYGLLTLSNNKLYGMTPAGGNSNCGTLIQYDAIANIFSKKLDFNPATGKRARSNQLVPVPAATAPGSTNSCINTQTININATNANQWIPFTDAQGRAVAEINANGNILGNTAVRFYIHGGNVRQDSNGVYYLDRSITITPTTQPATNVSIRLYVRKAEFDDLKNTPGSGVNAITDLNMVNNTDFCTAAIVAPTTPFVSSAASWASDYVYTASVTTLGSFYLIGNVPPVTTTVNLKLFIQDYYLTNATMKPVLFNQNESMDLSVTDSIDVELHSALFPFEFITSLKTVLYTNGTAVCNFPNTGVYYYLAIKHRNANQTWSSVPVLIGGPSLNYDFSISSAQAYGNTMIQVDPTVWAFYSGDLNDDENIDLLDLNLLQNDISNFQSGYIATDINGDGNVDLLDVPVMEANINAFVFSSHP